MRSRNEEGERQDEEEEIPLKVKDDKREKRKGSSTSVLSSTFQHTAASLDLNLRNLNSGHNFLTSLHRAKISLT